MHARDDGRADDKLIDLADGRDRLLVSQMWLLRFFSLFWENVGVFYGAMRNDLWSLMGDLVGFKLFHVALITKENCLFLTIILLIILMK